MEDGRLDWSSKEFAFNIEVCVLHSSPVNMRFDMCCSHYSISLFPSFCPPISALCVVALGLFVAHADSAEGTGPAVECLATYTPNVMFLLTPPIVAPSALACSLLHCRCARNDC